MCIRDSIFGLPLDPEGAFEIARRARGTPRIANRLLRRVRDFAEVRAKGHITKAVADLALTCWTWMSMVSIIRTGVCC